MAASMLRPLPSALALVIPAALGLLATMCSETPSPVSPAAQAAAPPPDASSSGSWTVPSVPLARRTVLLLRPPPVGPDASAIQPIAPDPTALVEKSQWVYEFRYDKGEVYLVGVHPTELKTPRETPRVMGRFALEIYSGRTLIERVRFDFPGLGAGDEIAKSGVGGEIAPRPHGRPVSFTAKLRTRVGVMLPATPRGTKLELWDRATNERFPLPWPAVEMTAVDDPGALADGGAGDAAPPEGIQK